MTSKIQDARSRVRRNGKAKWSQRTQRTQRTQRAEHLTPALVLAPPAAESRPSRSFRRVRRNCKAMWSQRMQRAEHLDTA